MHVTVNSPCEMLRAQGRAVLQGNWQQVIIVMLMYLLFSQVITSVFTIFELETIGNIYTILVSGPLALGMSSYFLKILRKKPVTEGHMFEVGISNLPKALGLILFQALFIILWALLFIIPGVIAAIRYSQAFFIMADDPSKGIRQCMDESKELMKGNKSKFFFLTLSFIGWMLLFMAGYIVAGIPVYFLMYLNVDLALIAYSIVYSILYAPLGAYINATHAVFYGGLTLSMQKEVPGSLY